MTFCSAMPLKHTAWGPGPCVACITCIPRERRARPPPWPGLPPRGGYPPRAPTTSCPRTTWKVGGLLLPVAIPPAAVPLHDVQGPCRAGKTDHGGGLPRFAGPGSTMRPARLPDAAGTHRQGEPRACGGDRPDRHWKCAATGVCGQLSAPVRGSPLCPDAQLVSATPGPGQNRQQTHRLPNPEPGVPTGVAPRPRSRAEKHYSASSTAIPR